MGLFDSVEKVGSYIVLAVVLTIANYILNMVPSGVSPMLLMAKLLVIFVLNGGMLYLYDTYKVSDSPKKS